MTIRTIVAAGLILSGPFIGFAAEPQTVVDCQMHVGEPKETTSSKMPEGRTDFFEGVQIETSDIKSFEAFFGDVLKATVIERRDHPDKDSIRGYCYRGVRVTVRRDYSVPRPTGWVQVNFAVPDVGAVQREIETALKNSSVASLSDMERDRIVRFRLKPDARRGDRKAIRLEVVGPEGFMIGFNQYYKEEVRP